MKNKAQIRSEMRKLRRELGETERARISCRAVEQLAASRQFRQADSIASYIAHGNELDTAYLNELCLRAGKRLFIPYSTSDAGEYCFGEIESDTAFESGLHGIMEPVDCRPTQTGLIDLVVLPGLAFSILGARIGRGAGVYDRLLRGYRGICVGLAFYFQMVDEMPQEDHDCRCDCIATDREFMDCKKSMMKKNRGVESRGEMKCRTK